MLVLFSHWYFLKMYLCVTIDMYCLPEPTIITTAPNTLDVTVGESIILPCQVSYDSSLELKFTWFFNEQLIHFGSHGGYFEKVGGVRTKQLQIPYSLVYLFISRPKVSDNTGITKIKCIVFGWSCYLNMAATNSCQH